MTRRNSGDKIATLGYNKGDRVIDTDYGDSILNPHLDMSTHDGTHEIMDNIAQQFIQSNGMSGFFLPKEYGDVDRLFGEELEVKFEKAWQFAFYLETYTGFGGMGTMYAYGGLSANDEMKIMINPKLFQTHCDGRMPEIGDWVYIKNDASLFEVRYVDPYNKFYQFGYISQIFVVLSKVSYNQESLKPVLQNDLDFNLHDYDETDLDPLFNLDGRLDTNIDEFATSDYINKRAESIIIKDRPTTGTGHDLKPDVKRRKVESIDDINDLLAGKK